MDCKNFNDVQKNSTFIYPEPNYCGNTNKKYTKKKSKIWFIKNLFKRQETKSSDTDSSSDTDCKKKGFLKKRFHRHKGGSHKVVGKFETIFIPRNISSVELNLATLSKSENQNPSPNVIKQKYNREISNYISQSNQEIATINSDSLDLNQINGGSLDTASRRHEKQQIKGKVEAMRELLREHSSGSDDSSVQKSCQNDRFQKNNGSFNRKSRTARTDRYIRRHFQDKEYCHSSSDMSKCNDFSSLVSNSNPDVKYVAKVTCQHFSNYPLLFNSGIQNANFNSSIIKSSNIQPSNLLLKADQFGNQNKIIHNCSDYLLNVERNSPIGFNKIESHVSSQVSSLPFPVNINGTPKFPVDKCISNRPLSYAFDANIEQKNIISYMQHNNNNIEYNRNYFINNNLVDKLPYKSSSDLDLYHNKCLKSNVIKNPLSSDNIYNIYQQENYKKCFTNKNSESQNPIQFVKNESNDATFYSKIPTENKFRFVATKHMELNKSNHNHIYSNRAINLCEEPKENFNVIQDDKILINKHIPGQIHRNKNSYWETSLISEPYANNDLVLLNKMNEIGVPIKNNILEFNHLHVSSFCHNKIWDTNENKSSSVIFDKSQDKMLHPDKNSSASVQKCPKYNNQNQKPKNLEEALVELEEIYNSLRLSDEDLLDRADRKDLQLALKKNFNHFKSSYHEIDATSNKEFLSSNNNTIPISQRIPNRRSFKPDAVVDDMAYRKLNKKNNQDLKSNPNIVSQSGSFLLMSPTLCPPPFVELPTSTISQIEEEPDIMLDDVVFRNIRQANNTLKILDPQPPFGIPLGPISSASSSDYLHVNPSGKYRSTFHPSRIPDIVADDLAYRNLRKDLYKNGPDVSKQHLLSNNDSKKQRAIRSLSANVVSLISQNNDSYFSNNEDNLIDINGNKVKKSDRSVSFNNLPDIKNNKQKKNNNENFNKYSNHYQSNNNESNVSLNKNNGNSLCSIVDKMKLLNKELEKKSKAFEDVSLTENTGKATNHANYVEKQLNHRNRDVFIKSVAVHKPITINQLKLRSNNSEKKLNYENLSQTDGKLNLLKNGVHNSDLLSEENQKLSTDSKKYNSNDTKNCCEDECRTAKNNLNNNHLQIKSTDNNCKNNESTFKNLCQNFNWKTIKIVCAQYHPKNADFTGGECKKSNDINHKPVCFPNKNVMLPSNSESFSSSISSFSDSSNSCKKLDFTSDFCSGTYKSFQIDVPSSSLCFDENIELNKMCRNSNNSLVLGYSKACNKNLLECSTNSDLTQNDRLVSDNTKFNNNYNGKIQGMFSTPKFAGSR